MKTNSPTSRLRKKSVWLNLTLTITVTLLAVGCATWERRENHHANSLYNYLYASQPDHVDAETIPTLSLPLRVGIAFVPDENRTHAPYAPRGAYDLSEATKMNLMQEISTRFKQRPFIKSIDQIPSGYLTPKGGFANLQQIRTMYGVDVMVLLSYDQAQFTDQGFWSLSYWTIVGAYVVQGEKNDTQTMLDGAVYDIASHKLLFRAPGLSAIKGSATPINLDQQLREDSQRGFEQAATNLVTGLDLQLDNFRQRVKETPSDYKITTKPGYTGAASLSGLETILTCVLGAGLLCTRRTRQVSLGQHPK